MARTRKTLSAHVSILTRPYGRMLSSLEEKKAQTHKFQSSPALTGGCYADLSPPHAKGWGVSILTRPYGRMLLPRDGGKSRIISFQSSPALTGGCYSTMIWLPGGYICGFNPHPPLRADAIREVVLTTNPPACFNPHPPLRADAIGSNYLIVIEQIPFQSSPALTGGCYGDTTFTFPGIYCFNPHPPLRADAMSTLRRSTHSQSGFNPHPPLRADAICAGHGGRPQDHDVSILTRPYGRMLSEQAAHRTFWPLFQSSPALTGGCYR